MPRHHIFFTCHLLDSQASLSSSFWLLCPSIWNHLLFVKSSMLSCWPLCFCIWCLFARDTLPVNPLFTWISRIQHSGLSVNGTSFGKPSLGPLKNPFYGLPQSLTLTFTVMRTALYCRGQFKGPYVPWDEYHSQAFPTTWHDTGSRESDWMCYRTGTSLPEVEPDSVGESGVPLEQGLTHRPHRPAVPQSLHVSVATKTSVHGVGLPIHSVTHAAIGIVQKLDKDKT